VLALAPQVKRNDLMDIAGDPRMPVGRRKYLTRLARESGGARRLDGAKPSSAGTPRRQPAQQAEE
jgi:hypothetical protein